MQNELETLFLLYALFYVTLIATLVTLNEVSKGLLRRRVLLLSDLNKVSLSRIPARSVGGLLSAALHSERQFWEY